MFPRLKPTRAEVGGWPPIVISFQHFYDKEAVLKRSDMLDRSGLLLTEDMSRSVRENWGELNKFMSRVSMYRVSKKNDLFEIVDIFLNLWNIFDRLISIRGSTKWRSNKPKCRISNCSFFFNFCVTYTNININIIIDWNCSIDLKKKVQNFKTWTEVRAKIS